ncbi:hypothetical protein [Bacillus wiedmannii]|nr:hypothetical protein [Bacillus wiedmannii]
MCKYEKNILKLELEELNSTLLWAQAVVTAEVGAAGVGLFIILI